MDIQKLKHYDAWLKAIELYATASRIKIKWVDDGEYGQYSPNHRGIKIDDDLSQSCTIAVLLHELGHSLDEDFDPNKPNSRLNVAYTAYYKGKYTEAQHKSVIACEQKAWDYGRVIARKLKIRLGKWYDYHSNYFLRTYKKDDTKYVR